MKTLLPFFKTLSAVLVFMFLLAFSQTSFGQSASATWNLTASNTPVLAGSVTSNSPTFGSSLSSTGSTSGTYGLHATNWPTSSSSNPGSSNAYFQFEVSPTGSNSLTITSVSLSTQTNEGHFPDYMEIYYSTSATFATYTRIGSSNNNISTSSSTYTNSSFSATATSGQTLYFRVFYYGTNSGYVEYGAKSFSVSGTTTLPASIAAPTVSGSYCVTGSAGSSFSLAFSSTGTYSSNTYTAQLSDASGSFSSPVNIGSLVSTANSGNIPVTIPAATATGAGYQIRVVSSNPAVTGTASSAFTVNYAANSVSPSTTQNINASANGALLTVTEQSTPTSRQWYYGTVSGGPYSNSIGGATSTTYTPNFASQGTYYVVCVSTFSCGSITSNQTQIVVSPTLTTSAISTSTYCVTASAGASISVPFTSAGTFSSNTYTAQLSNASGSFASPVTLGTTVSNLNSGTISGTIPAATASGNGYLVRVISNSPSITGATSPTTLTVNYAAASVSPTTTQNINTSTNGTALTVTEQATPSSRQWYYSTTSGGPYTNAIGGATGTSYTPNFSSPGTYYVVCSSVFSCATIVSSQTQINVTTPAIAAPTISGSPFCVTAAAGASISIPFTSTGNYASNTYTAQLSNASGSFASPVTLGTTVSNLNSGTISGTIPASTATGSGYLVRVVSSSPAVNGTASSSIVINYASNSVVPSSNQSITAGVNGTVLTVTEQSAVSSRQWYYGTSAAGPYSTLITGATGTSYTPNFSIAGTYYIVCKSVFACSTITSNAVQVTVNPGALATLNISTVSSPQPVDATFTGSAVTITGIDAYGNAVSGGTVNFTTTAGTITPASATLSSTGSVTISNFKVTASGTGKTITATSGAVFVLSNTFTVNGYTSSASDYFRSAGSTDWSSTATWQSSPDGTNWYSSTLVPTSASTSITIQSGHTVSVSSSVGGDAMTINSGGAVNINSGGTLTISNGSGTDLTISGTLNVNAGGTLYNQGSISSTVSTLLINSGATYQHAQDGGSIPTATWNSNSTCLVTGAVSNTISGLSQSFGNFTWNSTGQAFVDDGYGVGVDKGIAIGSLTVNGNFTLNSTGSGLLTISSLTIKGYYSQTGGTLVDFANINTGSTTASMYLAGDFTMSGGSLGSYAAYNSATLNIYFNGTLTQHFSKTGGSIIQTNAFAGTESTNFIVNNASILDFGTSVLDGAASFTLSSGATLITANTNGIAASGSAGSVQVSGTRSYNASANYTYDGTSAQVTGSGLPATLSGKALKIDNVSGVSLSQNTNFNSPDTLFLVTGNFTLSSGGTGRSFNLGSGSSINRDNGNLVLGSPAGSLNLSSMVNVAYTNLGINSTSVTTGLELPSSSSLVGNLTINKPGATITLGAPTFVNGILYLTSGTLTTSSTNLLTLNSGATATVAGAVSGVPQASSPFVNGPLQKIGNQAFIFPVGVAGTGCVPIGISAPANATDAFTAQYFRSSPGLFASSPSLPNPTLGLDHVSRCDYWNLSRVAGTSTINVTGYWNTNNPCAGQASGYYVNDLTTVVLSHYNTSTLAWDKIGRDLVAGTTTTGSVTMNNVSNFSPFALGSNMVDNPLPVVLVNFDAVLNSDKTVKVSWKTEQEVNSSHFEVERSADGVQWNVIGTVQAKGNSPVASNYEFTDASPLSGTDYYRLKIVNLDNAYGYTTVKAVHILTIKGINIYPNPAREYVNVTVGESATDLSVRLINQVGQVLQTGLIKAGAGATLSLPVGNYPQGAYLLQIKGADGSVQTSKVLIMK